MYKNLLKASLLLLISSAASARVAFFCVLGVVCVGVTRLAVGGVFLCIKKQTISGGGPGPPRFAFRRYQSLLELRVDAVSNPLIMRPTSSVVGTKNSLRFNELNSQDEV